jgi:hypothetical protein
VSACYTCRQAHAAGGVVDAYLAAGEVWAIRAHLDYISRHGRLVLKTKHGERHIGKEDWHGWAIAGSTAGADRRTD